MGGQTTGNSFNGTSIVLGEQRYFFGNNAGSINTTQQTVSQNFVYAPVLVVPNNGSVTFTENVTLTGKNAGQTTDVTGSGIDCNTFVQMTYLMAGYQVPAQGTLALNGYFNGTNTSAAYAVVTPDPGNLSALVGTAIVMSGHTGIVTNVQLADPNNPNGGYVVTFDNAQNSTNGVVSSQTVALNSNFQGIWGGTNGEPVTGFLQPTNLVNPSGPAPGFSSFANNIASGQATAATGGGFTYSQPSQDDLLPATITVGSATLTVTPDTLQSIVPGSGGSVFIKVATSWDSNTENTLTTAQAVLNPGGSVSLTNGSGSVINLPAGSYSNLSLTNYVGSNISTWGR